MPDPTSLPLPEGPFETRADATNHPAVQEIFEAASLADASHRMLDEACTAADIDLANFEHHVLLWLAGWEPETCAVVAALITRAHKAGTRSNIPKGD